MASSSDLGMPAQPGTGHRIEPPLPPGRRPIFEADLQPEQYAYRRGRGAHDAGTPTRNLKGGHGGRGPYGT